MVHFWTIQSIIQTSTPNNMRTKIQIKSSHTGIKVVTKRDKFRKWKPKFLLMEGTCYGVINDRNLISI